MRLIVKLDGVALLVIEPPRANNVCKKSHGYTRSANESLYLNIYMIFLFNIYTNFVLILMCIMANLVYTWSVLHIV